MRERDVERHLVNVIKRLGGEVRKVRWIGRRGAPDRLVMFPDGTSWWVELKAPGKKAEPHQLREHARLAAMRQNVLVLDSIEAIDGVFA